jgi:hypothetical protein
MLLEVRGERRVGGKAAWQAFVGEGGKGGVVGELHGKLLEVMEAGLREVCMQVHVRLLQGTRGGCMSMKSICEKGRGMP